MTVKESAMLLLMMLAGLSAHATQTITVWDGVYTTAQATRGKVQYEASCTTCHGPDLIGGVGRQLKGDVFMRDWSGEDLSLLFARTRNMPPGAASSLSESAYLEIIAYILQSNAFPAGAEELKVEALKGIRIQGKDGPDEVPDFALVQVVGCLTEAAGRSWVLTDAGELVRTKDPEPSRDEERNKAEGRSLGNRMFRLLYVYPDPAPHNGHRVEVKGLLIKMPNDDRINVTSLQSLAGTCK